MSKKNCFLVIVAFLILLLSLINIPSLSVADISFPMFKPTTIANDEIELCSTIANVENSATFFLFGVRSVHEMDVVSVSSQINVNNTVYATVRLGEAYEFPASGENSELGQFTLFKHLYEYPNETYSQHDTYIIPTINIKQARIIQGTIIFNKAIQTSLSFCIEISYKVIRFESPPDENFEFDISYLPNLQLNPSYSFFSSEFLAEWKINFPWFDSQRTADIIVTGKIIYSAPPKQLNFEFTNNRKIVEHLTENTVSVEFNKTEIFSANVLSLKTSNLLSFHPQTIQMRFSETPPHVFPIQFNDPILGWMIIIIAWVVYFLTLKRRTH